MKTSYSKYTKEKWKGIKAYQYRILLNHKRRQRGRKELQSSQKIMNKTTLVSSYLHIITLNVNVLNFQVKIYRLNAWIFKK